MHDLAYHPHPRHRPRPRLNWVRDGSRLLFGSKSKSRDFEDSALRLLLIAAILVLVAAPACAQEAVEGNEESKLLVKDLGRKSQIGDETFVIAALMAMRHPKSIVLSGALSVLVVMTVSSTGLGRIVPNLISRKHTNSAATDPKSSQKKVMEEVEEKLEAGQGKSTLQHFFSRFLTPIFLGFLADWGVLSQIATIVLGTHKNAVGVAVGATIGHTICTSLAEVGGSMLASKISQRTVATVGGFLFLGFSISSFFYPSL